MSEPAIAEDLRDVAAGVLTPFAQKETDEIRFDKLALTAQWLSDSGIDLFLSCANISEYHSLTNEERIESVRVACNTLDDDATVLGGVGETTKTAINLATAHTKNGADGIMIMPPDHVFKHENGVVDYYHRIADAVDIGVVPYIRGMAITAGMVDRIAAHERVVGIKWAVADIELFSECVDRVGDVVWLCGMAEPPAPAYYMEGAEGFSAGVTNFEPRLGLALFDALEAGDYERARQLRALSRPLMNLRAESGEHDVYPAAKSIPVVKQGLELAGQYGGPVREPLVELPASDRERVRTCYEDLEAGLQRLDVIESAE